MYGTTPPAFSRGDHDGCHSTAPFVTGVGGTTSSVIMREPVASNLIYADTCVVSIPLMTSQDLVLSQSALDRCCYELTAFVDMFLGETIFEPVLDPTNVMGGATLRKSSSQGEADGYLNIASRKDEADDWANVQNALKTKGARDDFDGLDGFAFEL